MEKTNREDEEEDNDNEKKKYADSFRQISCFGVMTHYYVLPTLYSTTHQLPYLTTQFKKTKRKIEIDNTVIQISWQIQNIIWSFHLVELHLQFNVLDSSR